MMSPARPPHASSNEPPLEIAQLLLQHFLPHAAQLGFFLHKQHFIAAASTPDTRLRAARLSRALLNAVYLHGARLSRTDSLTVHESLFLNRAVEAVSTDLSKTHQFPITQTIQAEVLLANYFFCASRKLEGRYHCSAAVALVLSGRLNTLQPSSPEACRNPPLDRVEEGEKISAFWSVFVLEKCWAVVCGSISQLNGEDDGVPVDTPWPIDVEDYDQRQLAIEVGSSRTVYNFLHDVPSTTAGPTSMLALRAKAASLFERASRLSTQSAYLPSQLANQAAEAEVLNRVLNRFIASLPSIQSSVEAHVMRDLLLVHTLTRVARIKAHSGAVTAAQTAFECQSLDAAQAAAALLSQVNISQMSYIDPMMAPLWSTIARTLIGRIQQLGRREGERDRLDTLLQIVKAALLRFSHASPSMAMELEKL